MIQVTIFEDYADMRQVLTALVEQMPDACLLGAYPDANDAVNIVKKARPDVVLMDLQMPGISGIEATRRIKMQFPDVQVLIQTIFDDHEHIFAALCMGATGYILKGMPAEKISDAIRETAQGGTAMSPSIARKVLTMFAQQQTILLPDEPYQTLSEREKEILGHLTKGKSYKMIADECGISYGTVNSHLKNIYQKLYVHSATEAVQKALLQRLV